MRKNRLLIKMVGKRKKLLLAKYIFFGFLILCLTVVSFMLYISDNLDSHKEDLGDVKYVKISSSEFWDNMLDSNFETCFFSNASNFTQPSPSILNNESSIHQYRRMIGNIDLINIFLQFADISRELGIETVLIEPSLLFCILSPTLKRLLSRRHFTLDASPERVLTLGIFQKDAFILEKEDVHSQLSKIGYHVEIVDSPVLKWMKSDAYINRSVFTGHVFLQKDQRILHLVVFHERQNFLWHSALLSQGNKEALLFVDADAAFENFTAASLGLKNSSLENVKIPTNPASFLHQISTSRFVECNETVINSFRRQAVSNLSTNHAYSSLSSREFNQRLLIALQEMKLILDPMLIRFWLWSGTLLGLHRQCDVIPYTSDADFATWETDAEDVETLIVALEQNEHLSLKEKLGMVEEGLEIKLKCHGLSVDLFFVYGQENGTWYAGHVPRKGCYFKYHHPPFSLCSAELLGERVNVPCQSERVISSEYGSQWMYPVSSWSYVRSAHNRGPDIFWKEDLLGKVYRYF